SSGNSQADIEKITLKIVPWFSYGIFIIAGFSFLLNYCYLSQGLSGAVLSAIAVLIISCPCALALSVPTAVGSGIFLGLKKGILIRDGAVMEKMQGIKNYFFDKTGTLTEGSPSVINYSFFSDRKDIPAVIYKMEYGSSHPSGRSIRSFLEKEFPDECHQIQIDLSEVQNHPGRGLEMNHAGKISKLGSYHFIFSKNDEPDAKIRAFLSENLDSSCIFFSENDIVYAAFALKDSLRPSSKETTEILMQEGNVYILTGDSRSAAEAVGKELLLPETHVYSELKPEEKQKMIETIAEKEAVCMMGDGYNDSVALSAADVSVVLSRGAPLSLEHAQVILLNNDPYDLLTAKRISEKTMFTIRLNLIFSLGYNLIAIPFAALGYLLPVWCAVFMSVSSLTVVGSSIYFRWRGV
ncbi:MAG: HAD-IC family P-type ATPase, partial [Spirochaetia bacterium]|nr:HAD-IC family P-type ATPase [Spirochaetia bacterium]